MVEKNLVPWGENQTSLGGTHVGSQLTIPGGRRVAGGVMGFIPAVQGREGIQAAGDHDCLAWHLPPLSAETLGLS